MSKQEKCQECGRTYPRGYDFWRVDDGKGGWRLICRVCAPGVEDLERFLPSRRPTKENTERRRFRRISGHLLLSYRHVRSKVERRGVARDISQGGMRFVAEEELTSGELLNVTVSNPLRRFTIKAVARVRWTRERGDRFETGVEFVARRQHFDVEDRRRHQRHVAAFRIECETGDRIVKGRVKDISQGGVRFICPEPLEPGSKLTARLEASGCTVISSEDGIPLQVERSAVVVGVRKGREMYEVRARFLPLG